MSLLMLTGFDDKRNKHDCSAVCCCSHLSDSIQLLLESTKGQRRKHVTCNLSSDKHVWVSHLCFVEIHRRSASGAESVQDGQVDQGTEGWGRVLHKDSRDAIKTQRNYGKAVKSWILQIIFELLGSGSFDPGCCCSDWPPGAPDCRFTSSVDIKVAAAVGRRIRNALEEVASRHYPA